MSKHLMSLFDHSSRSFTVKTRHLIYSYLDRSTVLQKISILSKHERELLVDSTVAAKNKSYSIVISGQRQRNA